MKDFRNTSSGDVSSTSRTSQSLTNSSQALRTASSSSSGLCGSSHNKFSNGEDLLTCQRYRWSFVLLTSIKCFFQSLVRVIRFHGKILFREIALDVYRIWQPLENVILIRWNLRGVPQVPWEAKGEFQGTSRYKLDRNGKIYEHKVDNLAFNFPQILKPILVFDLVTACPASPNLTFSWGPLDSNSSSWLEFYQAVKDTVDQEERLLPQDCMATCS
ncbi:hypothetical protein GmHk_05G013085 [Glycine max]|nr:hypothetical protein GmHk_05G013085 [Glycine max]